MHSKRQAIFPHFFGVTRKNDHETGEIRGLNGLCGKINVIAVALTFSFLLYFGAEPQQTLLKLTY
jgi:hypothetical protein